jgi:hypothetical protein
MAWLPPRSPQRASWIQEIGKIAQVRGDYTEARRTADQVKLAADSIHTIVVLDHTGHLALDPLQDAAGSRVTPQGAPPTGLGGTASRPDHALLPWAGALAAGLALTLAGGLALRRRHIASHAAR